MWFNKFLPVVQSPQRHIAEVMLWLFYRLGLCCTIVGEFAMYVGGKLASHSDLITIYMAYHPQMSPEIAVLLQIEHTAAFSIESLDFLFMPAYSSAISNVFYTVRCGAETAAVRITCVDSFEICGPRSNLDLTRFIWKTFTYYFTNYAIAVLPSQNFDDKIVYVCHYKAEIRGEDSRTCKRCFWDFENPRMFYNFECQKPYRCTCTLCCKQPLSLKTLTSKILFVLDNLDKFCFDTNTTYEYAYAVRSGVNLLNYQLVPFALPDTLTINFIQFDDFLLAQFHEHCSLAVDVQGNGKWNSTSQRRFETPEEFASLVLRCKTILVCIL